MINSADTVIETGLGRGSEGTAKGSFYSDQLRRHEREGEKRGGSKKEKKIKRKEKSFILFAEVTQTVERWGGEHKTGSTYQKNTHRTESGLLSNLMIVNI